MHARAHSRSAHIALVVALLAGAPACHDGGSEDDATGCASTGPCLGSAYDPQTGSCEVFALKDGTACDDDNVCTQQDACANGYCLGASPVDCGVLDSCGLPGACDPVAGCAVAASTPCIAEPAAIALGGCALSSYWVTAQLGSGQSAALLLDSGSGTLAVASTLCPACGVTPLYSPAHAVATGQDSNAQYVDTSAWGGTVYQETVGIGASASVSMDLAAMSTQSQFFTPDICLADVTSACGYQGIIGMGTANLTAPNTDAFMDKLAAQGNTGFVFATQLCDSGGNLWLGGYDPNYVAEPPKFTPMNVGDGFYSIAIEDMQLGTTSLGFDANDFAEVVVDTGTSVFVLPQDIYNGLTAALEANSAFAAAFGAGYFANGSCQPPASTLTRAEVDAQLPTLNIVLPQAGTRTTFTLALPPSQSYLVVAPEHDGTLTYCPALAPGANTTLGASAMRSQVAIFAAQAYQMGFAPQKGCAQ